MGIAKATARTHRRARIASRVTTEPVQPPEKRPVQEDNEPEDEDMVEGMTAPAAASSNSDEGTGPDDGGTNSHDEEAGHGNADLPPPPSQTENPAKRTKGKSSSQVKKKEATDSPLPSSTRKSTKSVNKLKSKLTSASPKVTADLATPLRSRSSTDGKHDTTPSQLKSSGITPVLATLMKNLPPIKPTRFVSSSSKARSPCPSAMPPTRLSLGSEGSLSLSRAKVHSTTQVVENTSEKVFQGESSGPVDSDATAARNPSPSPVVEPEPNGNEPPAEPGNPSEGSSASSPLIRPYKSDIESLYASPSPEAIMGLEPIELESDPDFEMMEQLLLSHRGPHSSQSIKKEPSTQLPAPLKTPRPLKRERSHPSTNESFHASAQEPQADAKRPRVSKPRSSDPAAVSNDRRKHPEFWDLDGTVVLQVDDVLFRVMRSTLGKASPWFQRLFRGDFEHLETMAGCPVFLIEEDLSHLDFANLMCGLENGLEYALNPPHYLRIASIFHAASLLEFSTLRKWSLGCLEKMWPADLPPPSKPSRFGSMIPWAEETLSIANLFEVPQLAKRAYWELCTRPEFGRIDAEVDDNEVEEIVPTRSRLPRSVIMDLTRLRERLFPEWTRITRSPPIDFPCTRAVRKEAAFTSQQKPKPCSLDYANWHKVILEVEVNDMTIDNRRMDLISALEVMVVEIDWEKEGGFCPDCVRVWKTIWTKDREKVWKNLGDWLGLNVAS